MLFNSYIFIFAFLPLTIGIYYWSGRKFGRETSFALLVLASFIYYAYWKFAYLPLLLISIVFNYGLGVLLSRTEENGKPLLIIGVILNIVLLGYFKYTNFFLESLQWLIGDGYSTLNIVLPLAISFFTFQQIAYLVDAYRGEAKEYSFIHYCLFISFFPQLIAGPIVHHREMLPQFMDQARRYFDRHLFWQGLQQFCLGLFKKVIIADSVALYATPVFLAADQGHSISFTEAWIATLAYTFQLYFDFSAYSDMAIGIGKMFGIDLPKNFDSPYKSKSITEFWRRWHMTLSRFLRDYLYFALGGNRGGGIRRYRNLLLTMVLGGLWHGASWNFVAWGTLHGVYLVINHAWRRLVEILGLNSTSTTYRWFAQLLTFIVVMEAWVLFRAETFTGAASIYQASIQFSQFALSDLSTGVLEHIFRPTEAIAVIAICALITFYMPNSQEFVEQTSKSTAAISRRAMFKVTPTVRAALSAALLVLSISSMNKVSEFLYFQF